MAKYNEKYFGKNSEVCAVENMLSAGEQIILREKPKRNAYILAQVLKMMPFALLWIVFDGAFIGLMIGFELFKSMPAPLIVFLIVFFAFHLDLDFKYRHRGTQTKKHRVYFYRPSDNH